MHFCLSALVSHSHKMTTYLEKLKFKENRNSVQQQQNQSCDWVYTAHLPQYICLSVSKLQSALGRTVYNNSRTLTHVIHMH